MYIWYNALNSLEWKMAVSYNIPNLISFSYKIYPFWLKVHFQVLFFQTVVEIGPYYIIFFELILLFRYSKLQWTVVRVVPRDCSRGRGAIWVGVITETMAKEIRTNRWTPHGDRDLHIMVSLNLSQSSVTCWLQSFELIWLTFNVHMCMSRLVCSSILKIYVKNCDVVLSMYVSYVSCWKYFYFFIFFAVPTTQIDCVLSQWSPWSPCTETCGSRAVKQRTRRIMRAPSGRGARCGVRLDRLNCELMPCPFE